MDILKHNRAAWDAEVERGNPWTIPVDAERIAAARRGEWQVFLTPTHPVPDSWFPPLNGANVLCLASGGGQQGPVLSAAGANVTVLDNSPRQLARDREVAERESLDVETVLGDMTDLACFEDESFDLIVHPVSNCFVPDVRPVWRESYRVLKPWGQLLAGFSNGAIYIFDEDAMDEGRLEVKRTLPYSDVEFYGPEGVGMLASEGRAVEFGHTLTDQIGGQLAAGFVLNGLYEDGDTDVALGQHMSMYIATRSLKPGPVGERSNR